MSDTNERVKQLVARQLGVSREQITDDSTFIDDLGADSLDIVELVMAVEEEFGINIPDEEAEKLSDIDDLVKLIDKYDS